MKLTPTLFCLIFISLTIKAQQNGRPGYIVRFSGDTLHGFLKEQPVGDLLYEVAFKQNVVDNEFKVYRPAEIKAFQYEGDDAYRTVTFSNTFLDHPIIQTCFARLLVSGECDLYSFIDKDVLFFLARKDSSYHLLYDDDLHAAPYTRGNFRNELNFFAVGCESIRSGIEAMVYNEENLTRFFKKLDDCLEPGKASAVYYHKAKVHFGFFAYAGEIIVDGSRSQFAGEARLRLVNPRIKPLISLNLGLHYANVVRPEADPTYLVAKIEHKVTYSMISIPLTIQYNLTHGIVQPFLYAGISMYKVDISSDLNPVVWGDPFYKSWGPAALGGVGVEVAITHFLQARLDWRFEDFLQYPTLGASIRF